MPATTAVERWRGSKTMSEPMYRILLNPTLRAQFVSAEPLQKILLLGYAFENVVEMMAIREPTMQNGIDLSEQIGLVRGMLIELEKEVE